MGTRADYVTRPRELIAAILRSAKRFISAAEIHRTLATDASRVSLATVYRTLEHLREKGEAEVRVDDAGEATYMLCEPLHHHHHAICSSCSRVVDVDCEAMEQFTDALRKIHGFELHAHKVEFVGRCRACQ
jgi:Fur family transcriptional regulator, ferric uptake regulator